MTKDQVGRGEQPFAVIARELREHIAEGRPGYQPGDKLPSNAEIAQEYGRNHITVRRAYDTLIAEGLVVSVPKVGYFVRRYPRLRYQMTATHDPARLNSLPVTDGWSADVQNAGFVGKQEIEVRSALGRDKIDVYTVAELFEDEPNDDLFAIVRAKVRYISPQDGEEPTGYEPESLANTYFPLRIAQGTPLMDSGSINTARFLAEQGHPQVDFLHEMISRLPRENEVRQLRLPRSSTVMERITVAKDPQGRPVYVQHVVTAGNGSRFIFRMRYQGDE